MSVFAIVALVLATALVSVLTSTFLLKRFLGQPSAEHLKQMGKLHEAAVLLDELREFPRRPLPQGMQSASPSSALPVVAGDPDKLCRTCRHFDLEEGQALASAHGPFAVAAQFVPPAEMGAVSTPEGEIPARDIPAKAKWQQFGLCHLRGEGLWGPTDAARRLRMQDDEGVVGAFLEGGVDCYEAQP